MEETPMTNKQIISKNKRNVPFRADEKVQHVISEHNNGIKQIHWVSKAADRGEQLIAFKDDPSNAVSAYFYKFAEIA
jgi:hypothetical protein